MKINIQKKINSKKKLIVKGFIESFKSIKIDCLQLTFVNVKIKSQTKLAQSSPLIQNTGKMKICITIIISHLQLSTLGKNTYGLLNFNSFTL